MEFYLVQHGEAAPPDVDPARPLTDRGREEVARVAQAAARLGVQASIIYHSGKLRAMQTAEILAAAIRPPAGLLEMGALGPQDDPAEAAALAVAAREPAMIVGHLPHLSRLASLLLAGNADREIVAFRMGAIVCLSGESGVWRLRWILTPETAA